MRDKYEQDGCLLPDIQIGPNLIMALRQAVLMAVRGKCGMSTLNPHFKFGSPNPFYAFLRLPSVLNMLEELLGPHLLLYNSQTLYKEAMKGRSVDWHQDGAAFDIQPMAGLTIWLALDDVYLGNGVMYYARGSHKFTLRHPPDMDASFMVGQVGNVAVKLGHITEPEEIQRGGLFGDNLLPVVRNRGQLAVHHLNCAHRSEPNLSLMPRAAVAFRVIPGSSLYSPKIPIDFPGCIIIKGSDFWDNKTIPMPT